jgi:hypothetical protein
MTTWIHECPDCGWRYETYPHYPKLGGHTCRDRDARIRLLIEDAEYLSRRLA